MAKTEQQLIMMSPKSSVVLPSISSRFLCTSLFNLASQLGRQAAGANWGKAGVLMWNLIEMCRSKLSSGAERWLCSVLNDCSQQCPSASSLRADNYTASATAWQTQGKVTLPLHHLHCVKYHYIRLGLMKTLTWAFEWELTGALMSCCSNTKEAALQKKSRNWKSFLKKEAEKNKVH